MTKNYVNLHGHGQFSFLDGHGLYEDYVDRAIALGMSALCVTEHGNVHGWPDLMRACKDKPIKPIYGIEMYQSRKGRFDRDDEERASGKAIDNLEQRGPYHLTVLARNKIGFQNIMGLSSDAYIDGYYVKPRMDHELLAKYSEGLIVLSGCLNGELQQALLRDDFDFALKTAGTMQEIVGKDSYFIEVQNHGLVEQAKVTKDTIAIANKIGAKIVPTCDCHYVHQHDANAHDVLICLSTNAFQKDENRFKFSGEEFYLKSYDEMAQLFPEEYLRNTYELAETIDVNLELGKFYFPKFKITTNETPEDYFTRLVWEGAKHRYGDNFDTSTRERIEYELRVIKDMGFPEYFLVVADIINWAKHNGIRVGVGRGSAAGCCVSYCLGITGLDPIELDLMFERFLVEREIKWSPIFEELNIGDSLDYLLLKTHENKTND